MSYRRYVIVCALLLIAPAALTAQSKDGGRALPRLQDGWSATLQSGITQGMQLSLGGLINSGPAQQNRLTINKSGFLRSRDSLQFYGWNTTALRQNETDADIGIRYRTPVARLQGGTLIAGGGAEYWHFPSVLGGTRDTIVDTYLGWNGGERLPITISGNGKTAVRSNLARGTMGIFQVQHTQKLARWNANMLSLNHGPSYVYSWGLYNKGGHRNLRYCMALVLSHKNWAVEGMLRPQAGLQPRIPDNRYWSVSVIRRFQ